MSALCLLFDLDGTLVLTGGAGIRAFDQAFQKVFQVDGTIKSVSPAGKTDPAILRELCVYYLDRDPTEAEEKEHFLHYMTFLRQDIAQTTKFRVLPGISSLLKRLSGIDHCYLGLGTGNTELGARIKLERPGLWSYFAFGGFGSDARERPVLLAKAVERGLARLPDGQAFSSVYVIGDTPLDIAAGKAIQAKTVGVATGPFSVQDLEQAGADLWYPDLADNELFLNDLGLHGV